MMKFLQKRLYKREAPINSVDEFQLKSKLAAL